MRTHLTRLIVARARYGKDSNPRPRGQTPDDKAGIDVDAVGDAMALEFALAETLRARWPPSPARASISDDDLRRALTRHENDV